MILGVRKEWTKGDTGGDGGNGGWEDSAWLLLAMLTWGSMNFLLASNTVEFFYFRISRESMVKYIVDLEVYKREVIGCADKQ